MDYDKKFLQNQSENNKIIKTSDIEEEEFFSQSKSTNNQEQVLLQKNLFDTNNKIAFTIDRVFKKEDFEILGLLGRGAYAKVVKAKLIQDNTIYAIKIIDKSFIEKVYF